MEKLNPYYFDWDLRDWETFHAHQLNAKFPPTIDTRSFNEKRKEYVIKAMPCQYEFKFMGFTFVSHDDPSPTAESDEGIPVVVISELHTGFKVAHGFDRYDARNRARQILIKNAKRFRARMALSWSTIGAHNWIRDEA